MIYMGSYTNKGIVHPIILISLIDEIEITSEEFILVVAAVLSVVAVLIFLFGNLLLRLSQRLIEPVNTLKIQLDHNQGDLAQTFSVPNGSAKEFQALAENSTKIVTRSIKLSNENKPLRDMQATSFVRR